MARIYSLRGLPEKYYNDVGGKARGLSILAKNGIKIARGFVAINVDIKLIPSILSYYTGNSYKTVAVRSSASCEDGEELSSAGQYDTVLNVKGRKQLTKAIKTCLASLETARAKAYNDNFHDGATNSMNIVIQEMVDAKYSGVTFTKNPVTRENKALVEVVEGLGEALVSGTSKSSSYQVDKLGNIEGEGIVSHKVITKVVNTAKKAKALFGEEIDLEWSIDKKGTLFFLQARPITTLDDATIDELNNPVDITDHDTYTTCNIGEMLPGAVTPLSISTSVACIDTGIRKMLIKTGAYRNLKQLKPGAVICTFENHCFFNLTTIEKMGSYILGANAGSVQMSICGRRLEGLPPNPFKKRSGFIRFFNAFGYFGFVLSRKKAMKKTDKLIKKASVVDSDDIKELYKNIDEGMYVLYDSMWYHYASSSYSGAMSSALFMVLEPYIEDKSKIRSIIADLLQNIDNIESVDILRSMKVLAKSIYDKHHDAVNMSHDEVYNIIANDESAIKDNYDYFIKRHGHRAIKEAELRSKSWKQDRDGLIDNLQTIMKSGFPKEKEIEFDLSEKIEEILKDIPPKKQKNTRGALKFLAKAAREGVYDREYTKSRFVKAVEIIKLPYLKLADMLVDEHILPNSDLIFFLTHEEVGRLINYQETKLIKKAFQRQKLFTEQQDLRYDEVYTGHPSPIDLSSQLASSGTTFTGIPISRGEVRGIARIVNSVEDAKKLQEGEIMICAFTDVGWSPYYTIVRGMVTEVGSALSHGAVVAREYALPLVVNVPNATVLIKNGDEILLNANKGTVTIL